MLQLVDNRASIKQGICDSKFRLCTLDRLIFKYILKHWKQFREGLLDMIGKLSFKEVLVRLCVHLLQDACRECVFSSERTLFKSIILYYHMYQGVPHVPLTADLEGAESSLPVFLPALCFCVLCRRRLPPPSSLVLRSLGTSRCFPPGKFCTVRARFAAGFGCGPTGPCATWTLKIEVKQSRES